MLTTGKVAVVHEGIIEASLFYGNIDCFGTSYCLVSALKYCMYYQFMKEHNELVQIPLKQ